MFCCSPKNNKNKLFSTIYLGPRPTLGFVWPRDETKQNNASSTWLVASLPCALSNVSVQSRLGTAVEICIKIPSLHVCEWSVSESSQHV